MLSTPVPKGRLTDEMDSSFETVPVNSSTTMKPSVYEDELCIYGVVPILRTVTTLFVLLMIFEGVVFATGMCTWATMVGIRYHGSSLRAVVETGSRL